ncbi:MAG: hypothetical protein ACRD5F_05435 [Candidatus Acidiferrales bacterium]
MGLDAAVFGNIKHLDLGPDEKLAQVDPETGQVYFDESELCKKYGRELKSVEHRLGNISEIAELREEIIELIGETAQYIKRSFILAPTRAILSTPRI